MSRTQRGTIDALGGYTILDLQGPTLPEDDFYISGDYTIWGVGLITFGAPTTGQRAWMANVASNSDLSTFPGDWISFGFSPVQKSQIQIWTTGFWVEGASITDWGVNAQAWSIGGLQGTGTFHWSDLSVVNGSALGETILGTSAAETINGLGGDDIILAGGGSDELHGGSGNDILVGGEGVDRLFGDAGDDFLDPGLNADPIPYALNNYRPDVDGLIDGGEGHDTLALDYSGSTRSVSLSADQMLAGPGFRNIEAVWLKGSQYVDFLTGTASDDSLYGGAGFDVLRGGAGNDWLDAGASGVSSVGVIPIGGTSRESATSLDHLFADAAHGPTVQFSMTSPAYMSQGFGAQPIRNVYSFTVDEAGAHGSLNFDIVYYSGSLNYQISIKDENGQELIANPFAINSSFIFPHAGTYYLDVDFGSTNVWDTAQVGVTLLVEGADVVTANKLYGGAGDDTFVVYSASDQVFENGNEGVDTVRSSVSWALGANVENLTLIGSAADGTGNSLSNLIIGNGAANQLGGGLGNDRLLGAAGADGLNGGDGADILAGGAGADRLSGGNGRDIFVFTASELGSSVAGDHDVITDFQKGDLIDISALYSGAVFGGLKAGTESQAATLSGHKAIYYSSGGKTYLVGDTDGVAGADFAIELTGTVKLNPSDLLIGKSGALSEREWKIETGLSYEFYHQDLLWT